MFTLRRAAAVFCATFALLALAAAADAIVWSCNFESGLGHDGQAIGYSVSGLNFSTLSGGDVRYADINSDSYSLTSDNGKSHEDGEYFMSGDVAAYVANLVDRAKISFTAGTADYFSIGYSSEFLFVIEAYDSQDNLLTSSTGAANAKSLGGTGLCYLTINSPGMAYVILHDQGGYWMVDNLSTDAAVPEPASIAVLAMGVLGLAARRKMS